MDVGGCHTGRKVRCSIAVVKCHCTLFGILVLVNGRLYNSLRPALSDPRGFNVKLLNLKCIISSEVSCHNVVNQGHKSDAFSPGRFLSPKTLEGST